MELNNKEIIEGLKKLIMTDSFVIVEDRLGVPEDVEKYTPKVEYRLTSPDLGKGKLLVIRRNAGLISVSYGRLRIEVDGDAMKGLQLALMGSLLRQKEREAAPDRNELGTFISKNIYEGVTE